MNTSQANAAADAAPDSRSKQKRWYKLDNAANIYPAVKSSRWNSVFRLSATLTEPIDKDILQQALEIVIRRMPSFSLRLRSGLFWYYFEQIDSAPPVEDDVANPCVRMGLQGNDSFMFRVRVHERRIAAEFFHALTDGTGGLVFLKTLIAEYLRIRYNADIPRGAGILDCTIPHKSSETEDSFEKYARRETLGRAESSSYHIRGTPDEPHYLNITTGLMSAEEIHERAKAYDVTVTEYLIAAFVMAIHSVQKTEEIKKRRRMPVKICTPVNLRNYYPSTTVRNFASFFNPGIDTRLGEFTFEETAKRIKHLMGLYTSEKMINARMSKNVVDKQNMALRVAPLFIKNSAMRYMHWKSGDRVSSSTLSNLGKIDLPDSMASYVTRFDFMLGALLFNPIACACVTYDGLLSVNFTRTIKETDIERHFFTFLVREGIHVKLESNRRE